MTFTVPLHRFQSANYRTLGLIGQGQFGQVYCAIHRKTGQLVALKHINRSRLTTHDFLREFRFLLSLDHPQIANCHALEQSDMGRQLVLDYCEAGTLRSLIEQDTRLTLAEILHLVTEVLTALEHAHRQGIVHCDIKPENILLTLTPDSWQVKISDFGIARLNQELENNRMGATGSPAYMAPERFYHQYAASSDLYAVGIVLYELLLGDRPFSGSHNQLMVAHLNHAVEIPTVLPHSLQSLLRKSLQKLMPRRFQRASEMKAAILQARQALTVAELNTHFPVSTVSMLPSQFRLQDVEDQITIDLPGTCQNLCCSSLGCANYAVLLAAIGADVYSWSLRTDGSLESIDFRQHWTLPTSISQLVDSPRGAIAVTDKVLYCLSREQAPQVLATFAVPIRIAAGSQRWMMVESLENPGDRWLVDAFGRLPQSPRAFTVKISGHDVIGVSLDDRHCLIAQVEDQKTCLQAITRWGKALVTLNVNTSLCQLVPGQNACQVLAQSKEPHKELLIIDLKPFRVMRCRTGIKAYWLGKLLIGFVGISQAGQLRIINFLGQIIGQVDGLPLPTAIAFQPPYHIWLATDNERTPRLHTIDIRTLELDVVF